MNNALAVIKRPRFYIPAILALLFIIGFLSIPRSKPLDDKTVANQAISPATIKKYDQQKTGNLYDIISRIVATYTSAHQYYPSSSSDGWNAIKSDVRTNSSFIDPYTKSIYTYVDLNTNPDFGQIQYAPGKACNTKSNEFKAGSILTIALRVRLFHSYKCVSTIEVQAKQQ